MSTRVESPEIALRLPASEAERVRGDAAALPSWPWRAIDAFLAPQQHRFDADERRRARLVVAICAAVGLLTIGVALNLVAHRVWGNLPVTAGILIVVTTVPFLLRWSGSLVVAGHAIAGSMAVALAALKFNTGALSVPPFIFLPGVPLVATLIAGPGAGLIWAGFAVAELTCFYVLAVHGIEPAIALNPDHLFRGRYVGAAVMVVFALLVAEAYERLKNRALGELVEARRLAEERGNEIDRARRQQLELKDRFLSHVSHELRTPLTALHQFLSLVLDEVPGKLGEEQRDFLAIAFRNAEQLRHMINDLTDLNRARNGKLRVDSDLLEPSGILEEAARNLAGRADEKRIRLETGVPERLPEVQGDATRIRQVISNLVENAIKFTPEGGRIEILAARDPEDDAFLRVSVRDNGCGIAPDAVERVFDSLQQEESPEQDSRLGLGLGLAIARELIQRQGGRIWAESELGRGSTFHFTLPVFSLARAIRPCMVAADRLRERFGIVSIQLRDTGAHGWHGLERGLLHLIRSTVFYPERDVVLPPVAAGPGGERFTVLAAADADGIRAIEGRLSRRLERFARERQRTDATFRIASHVEDLPAELASRPLDEALEKLAERVEAICHHLDADKED